VHPNRSVVRVEPVGELDMATAGRLRDTVDELLATGFAHVVVDLRELYFMDSSGLRLLLDFDSAARADGWRLGLIPGSATVMRVFEVTGIAKQLPFAEPQSRDGAG
jgi:anti-anti-sigma factor